MFLSPKNKILSNEFVAPPDKSTTHRALFFAALNELNTTIINPLLTGDCITSLNVLKQLGFDFANENGVVKINNTPKSGYDKTLFLKNSNEKFEAMKFENEEVEIDKLRSKNSDNNYKVLDCENSGTTARLLLGFMINQFGSFKIIGDESLSKRDMNRIIKPLQRFSLNCEVSNGTLPILIKNDDIGIEKLLENNYNKINGYLSFGVSSAQVFTSLVIACLKSGFPIEIIKQKAMRNHTEIMLKEFGAEFYSDEKLFQLSPNKICINKEIKISGDPSSAAYLVALGLLIKDYEVKICDVILNETRITFYKILQTMGAEIILEKVKIVSGETVGNIIARYSPNMNGITVCDKNNVSEMLDEIPIFCLIAATANGETIIKNCEELRNKESDRIKSTIELLQSFGISATETPDGIRLTGKQELNYSRKINSYNDHRIAMSATVGAIVSNTTIELDNPEIANVSFPKFYKTLGVEILN